MLYEKTERYVSQVTVKDLIKFLSGLPEDSVLKVQPRTAQDTEAIHSLIYRDKDVIFE